MSVSSFEKRARTILAKAGVHVNATNPRPWDIQVKNPELFRRLFEDARGRSLAFGEGYMNGDWECQAPDELIARLLESGVAADVQRSPAVWWLALRARLFNRQGGKRAYQAAHIHYDLPTRFFELTYDKRLTGSCGYWSGSPAAADLDAAQEAKLDLVCRKAGLKEGQHVYDIGCGWGAFMGLATEHYGVKCTGCTVSETQVAYIEKRYPGMHIVALPVSYPKVGNFKADHVVSMGMFEHVGSKNYRDYFIHAAQHLKEDGLFVLHTIVGPKRADHIDPWLDRYIFRNGVIPTEGQIREAVSGIFEVVDVHEFGHDYDKTLMAWAANSVANRDELIDIADRSDIRIGKDKLTGEQFYRMWVYYYWQCAAGFRTEKVGLKQFVLSLKPRPDYVPVR